MNVPPPDKTRCAWVKPDPLSMRYHDREWGVRAFDDRRLFEFLILESAQAGLSWDTILKKRAAYRQAFANFNDPILGLPVSGGGSTGFLVVTTPAGGTRWWTTTVQAGETLTDERGRYRATVRPDGQLDNGLVIGSIHKIGALVQGLPACNGWTFWHAERGGRRLCIDAFRSEIRAGMGAA